MKTTDGRRCQDVATVGRQDAGGQNAGYHGEAELNGYGGSWGRRRPRVEALRRSCLDSTGSCSKKVAGLLLELFDDDVDMEAAERARVAVEKRSRRCDPEATPREGATPGNNEVTPWNPAPARPSRSEYHQRPGPPRTAQNIVQEKRWCDLADLASADWRCS